MIIFYYNVFKDVVICPNGHTLKKNLALMNVKAINLGIAENSIHFQTTKHVNHVKIKNNAVKIVHIEQ